MVSVTDHYESHLAPVYVWMAGGIESATTRGRAEVDAVCSRPSGTQLAVDLGAGFGMHAIPLADIGYFVLAIDSSDALLETLDRRIGTRPIKTIRDDLLLFKRHLDGRRAALILCMGDTLTHLADQRSVQSLFDDVAESLDDGGTFIATFRDYSSALIESKRFIPVRSGSERILTCFLEYEDDSVTVYDILHERDGAAWRQRVSAYRKLRLSPAWVANALEVRGFKIRNEQGLAGMTRLVARRQL
jgi:hypothetical protein